MAALDRRRTGGRPPLLAFPAPSLWWFAYVALVPWIALIRSAPTAKRAAYDGWAGGFGFMVGMHHWLLPSLSVFIFVIGALLGALWAPWGALVRHFLTGTPSRGRIAAALAVLPSGWLGIELVRSWQGLGGPWGVLGASQWEVEPALRLASVGGVWLISFLLVAVNVALAVLVTVRESRVPALAGLVATAAVTSAAWMWSPRPDTGGTTRIAVVQPGVVDGPDKRFAREEQLTRDLAGQDVDLIVWGESSVGFDLDDRPGLAKRIAALSAGPAPTSSSTWTPAAPTSPASTRVRCSSAPADPPATATTRCVLCPSVSTSRPVHCSAGSPRSARRQVRTAGRVPSRS